MLDVFEAVWSGMPEWGRGRSFWWGVAGFLLTAAVFTAVIIGLRRVL